MSLVALPEGLSQLSSLQVMNLQDCRSLRAFPEPDIFARMPRLREIYLRGVCNPENDLHDTVDRLPSWLRERVVM